MGLAGLMAKRLLLKNKKMTMLYLGYKAAKFGYGALKRKRNRRKKS